jgi:hypothetical protein
LLIAYQILAIDGVGRGILVLIGARGFENMALRLFTKSYPPFLAKILNPSGSYSPPLCSLI